MVVKVKNGDKAPRRRGRKSGESVHHNHKSKKEATKSEKNTGKSHKSLLVELTEDAPTWYECGKQIPGRNATIYTDPPSATDPKVQSILFEYRSRADDIYRAEVQLFNLTNGESSDERWVENTMKRGTLKDRIAAMSVVASTDPVHKLHALDGLLQMAGCSDSGAQTNSRMAQMAAEALEDLFLNTLLPKHRKLLSMSQRPLYRYETNVDGKKTLSPRVLLLWRYEDMLKEKYQSFIRYYLAHTLKDGVEMSKLFAVRSAASLLRSVPEAEDQLLALMVNKLGDPEKKTAAAAGHELRRVLEMHQNMQVVIAREVQQLVHRPHLSPRALYNCIIFLNQLKLEAEEQNSPSENDASPTKKRIPKSVSLPASLVSTYFRLFEVAVGNASTDGTRPDAAIHSRLLSALLTGVNRARPYLAEEDKALEKHMDSLYRVVHTAPPSASTQALMLLFHVSGCQDQGKKQTKKATAKQDRFYRALYSSLGNSSMLSSGKHLTMLFNLFYKAMKYDTNSARVNVMAKRLLCTTMHCGPQISAASLFLLSEIMKFHPALRACFDEAIEDSDAAAVLDPTKREPMAALVRDLKEGPTRDNTVQHAALWEASLMAHHCHPSVAKFSNTLGDISYAGDPLRDFALAPFLDKFAYRNPKTAKQTREGVSVVARRSAIEESSLPVNDPSFLEKEDITEQEEFFHKFFVERARRDEIKGVMRGKGDADVPEEVEEYNALDIAEDEQMDHNFEEGWDTDPEEEAFVDALAEKLMDDSRHEEADLDDEDPDMGDWGDLNSDDDEAIPNIDADGEEIEDDFAEEDDSDSDVSNSNVDPSQQEDMDEDTFMDAADDDSSSDEGPSHLQEDDDANDSSDPDEDDLALLAGDSDSDDEEEELAGQSDKKSGKPVLSEAFVDASEYEELINKAWAERKRPNVDGAEDQDDKEIEDEAPEQASAGKKKRKRKKRKRSRSE